MTNTARQGYKTADLVDLAGKILAIFLAILARFLRAFLAVDLEADLAQIVSAVALNQTLPLR